MLATGTMDLMFAAILGVLFIVMFVVSKLWRRLRQLHYDLPAGDTQIVHRWYVVDAFTRPTYCAVSGRLTHEGAYCETCGVLVADENAVVADKTLPCKPTSLPQSATGQPHHWVRGNLPPGSQCGVCSEQCGNRAELCDVRCCWCETTAHDECSLALVQCEFGAFRDSIVPPTCVRLRRAGRVKGRRRAVVDGVIEPTGWSLDTWRPLIAVANRKSGSGHAEDILRQLRGVLNPLQVIDLSEVPAEGALEWCRLLPHVTWRVLVAGGDGTVGWVLSAIDKLQLKVAPEIYVIPLGTGNDLSRVLGLGEGFSGDVAVREVLHQMKRCRVSMLDRWRMEIVPAKHFGIRMPTKSLIVNNYASIGVDALVTLNFHRHRQSRPILFGSRLINKLWYVTYGTKDVLERECKDLQTKIQVELDGRCVELPSIEGIVVLNIASWGGGCRPWQIHNTTTSKIPEASHDDKQLEVIALYSSFHIAQLQVGLTEPLRLGQAKVVKITLLRGCAPMQVDGEPWEQHPATITLTHYNQATMLSTVDMSTSVDTMQ